MEKNYFGKTRQLMVLIVLTLAFIWGNSVLPADVSAKISDGLMKFLKQIWIGSSENSCGTDGFLRKFAHAFEFACLGCELLLLVRHNIKKNLNSVMLVGLSSALVDETIQLFSKGRASQVKDIWIDMLGFVIGICLVMIILRYTNNKSQLNDECSCPRENENK